MLCTVVGAGPGLGAALVRAFVGDGFDVAYLARRPQRVALALDESGTELCSNEPSSDEPGAGEPASRVRGFAADVDDPVDLARALIEMTAWGGETLGVDLQRGPHGRRRRRRSHR